MSFDLFAFQLLLTAVMFRITACQIFWAVLRHCFFQAPLQNDILKALGNIKLSSPAQQGKSCAAPQRRHGGGLQQNSGTTNDPNGSSPQAAPHPPRGEVWRVQTTPEFLEAEENRQDQLLEWADAWTEMRDAIDDDSWDGPSDDQSSEDTDLDQSEASDTELDDEECDDGELEQSLVRDMEQDNAAERANTVPASSAQSTEEASDEPEPSQLPSPPASGHRGGKHPRDDDSDDEHDNKKLKMTHGGA